MSLDQLVTENGHRAFILPSAGMGPGHRGWIGRCVAHNFFVEEHLDTPEALLSVEEALEEHLGVLV